MSVQFQVLNENPFILGLDTICVLGNFKRHQSVFKGLTSQWYNSKNGNAKELLILEFDVGSRTTKAWQKIVSPVYSSSSVIPIVWQ